MVAAFFKLLKKERLKAPSYETRTLASAVQYYYETSLRRVLLIQIRPLVKITVAKIVATHSLLQHAPIRLISVSSPNCSKNV